jgi:hypothetical protein
VAQDVAEAADWAAARAGLYPGSDLFDRDALIERFGRAAKLLLMESPGGPIQAKEEEPGHE